MHTTEIVLYFFVVSLIISVVLVAIARELLYSLLGLLLVFVCLVALYVFLGADFVATAQLMIYVGGILVLLVFGVMLANRNTQTQQILAEKKAQVSSLLFCVAVFTFLAQQILSTNFNASAQSAIVVDTTPKIGFLLLTNYIFAFEMAGILLLVALVGASTIAGRK